MKSARIFASSTAITMITGIPAFAGDTATTYSSGLLIGIFMAFCAMLVVVQMVPSLLLLFGFIRGLVRRPEPRSEQ